MATATRAIEPQVSVGPTKLLINNRWVDSGSGKTFPTVNPSNGEEICQVAEADAADVDKAVSAARAAFNGGPWRRMSASERGKLMNRLADLIEKNADELAPRSARQRQALQGGQISRPPLTIACYRYYAGWADKIQGKTIPISGDYFCYHAPRARGCRRACREDFDLTLSFRAKRGICFPWEGLGLKQMLRSA